MKSSSLPPGDRNNRDDNSPGQDTVPGDSFKAYLARCGAQIRNELDRFLKGKQDPYTDSGSFGSDVLGKIHRYSSAGKMIRGTLVFLGYQLFSREQVPDYLVKIALAMELFQSGLLIHDDVMDQDDVRRGEPSIHTQYRKMCDDNGIEQSEHIGESLAVCVGDLAFFLAFELIGDPDIPRRISAALLSKFSRELSLVGCAQMDDVYWSADTVFPSLEEILRMYRFKTGRYTFSLPLSVGGIIAGIDTLYDLERIGEDLGIIFQLIDDEIGLLGTESGIGKPVGSDILEGKKTVQMSMLMNALQEDPSLQDQFELLKSWFGAPDLNSEQIAAIRSMYHDSGVKEKIRQLIDAHYKDIKERISLVPVSNPDMGAVLSDLLTYNTNRRK